MGAAPCVRGPLPDGASYYALPEECKRGRAPCFPSGQVDTWLKQVLREVGAQPPAGETWSGHSLRIGAASAADALGVTLRRICWMGGWAAASRAIHDYVDPTCPASDAGRRYFGWLLP